MTVGRGAFGVGAALLAVLLALGGCVTCATCPRHIDPARADVPR